MNRIPHILFAVTVSILFATVCTAGDAHNNWPHWRGPMINGSAAGGNPPLRWSEKKNIRWKIDLPGKGSSTPIVWGDRIYVTTAMDTKQKAKPADIPKADPRFNPRTRQPDTYHQFLLLCIDRKSGKLLWKKVATEEVPHEGVHPSHSYGGGSPVTNGKHVFASFGTRGVYCWDMDGKLLWKKRLGTAYTRYGWGEASTPALHKDWLIVNWDHEGQSYVFALDAGNGNIRWKKKREEPSSWSTPLIVDYKGKTQVIVNATKIRSYDLQSGDVVWLCGEQSINTIPMPLKRGEFVYCMSGYRTSTVFAVPLNAKGDVSNSPKLRWKKNRSAPYIPSPLMLGNRLYYTAGLNPIISCVDYKTGEVKYRQRMRGMGRLYASPVGVGNRIYITDRNGVTLVMKAGDKFQPIASNRLDAPIDGSPVIVGDQIILRAHRHLYCIQESK